VQLPGGAEEIESLLGVLYHEWYDRCRFRPGRERLTKFTRVSPVKRLDPSTPSSVKQVLGIAIKYGMESVRQRIVMHVEGD